MGHALACSARAPVSVLGTVSPDSSCGPFHGRTELGAALYNTRAYSSLPLGPSMTLLPRVHELNRAAALRPLSERVSAQACVAASVPARYRNINRFPFRPSRVKAGLRTDSPLSDDH